MQDISQLWINASESGDFLIVCRNQEFPCHRAILSARFAILSTVHNLANDNFLGRLHLLVALPPVCLRQGAGGIYFGSFQKINTHTNRWTMRDAEGDDAEPLAVRDMLEYIYTSRISKDGIKERPGDLLDLAMQYQLPDLGEACKEAIIEGLTPQNAVVSLIQLDKYSGEKNEEEWKNKVLDFIKKNANAVVKGEHWKTFVKNYEDLVTEIVTCLAN